MDPLTGTERGEHPGRVHFGDDDIRAPTPMCEARTFKEVIGSMIDFSTARNTVPEEGNHGSIYRVPCPSMSAATPETAPKAM